MQSSLDQNDKIAAVKAFKFVESQPASRDDPITPEEKPSQAQKMAN